MADERFAAPGSAAGPRTGEGPDDGPATSLYDPRVIQVLSTEHWSLLSARSLVYNEAFTRGAMFLAFISASWVALALVAQAVGTGHEFQLAAVLVLAFDLVLGLTTYARIIRANHEDYLVLRGMARIRHVYVEIAPPIEPVLVSSFHDDPRGVMLQYGNPPGRGLGALIYAFSTSGGMIGLITAMIGGVLTFAVFALGGMGTELAVGISILAGIGLIGILTLATDRFFAAEQGALDVLYPTGD
jgi:hypothetical protein